MAKVEPSDTPVKAEDKETSGITVKDLLEQVESLRDVVTAQGKVTKRLEKENEELREEVKLLKRSFAGQQTSEELEEKSDIGEEVDGEEREREEFWALADLPRPSETSAAWVAFQAYSYTGMHALVHGLVLVAFLEWFPVTDYKSVVGVPAMNVNVVYSRWVPAFEAVHILGASFAIISSWESGVRDSEPWNAAWPAFPISVVTGTFWLGIHDTIILGLQDHGVDLVYYVRLDVVLYVVIVLAWVLSCQGLIRKAYHEWGWGHDAEEEEVTEAKHINIISKATKTQISGRRRSSVVEDEIRKVQRDDPKASIVSMMVVIFGIGFNMLLYPIVIIPYLNADTTTDFARVLIISVGLSILTEGTLIVMRFGVIKTNDKDFNLRAAGCCLPSRHSRALQRRR